MSRVLKTGNTQVTFTYAEHVKKCEAGQGWARGVDIVKNYNQCDWITAHTDGKIIKVVDYLDGTNGVLSKDGWQTGYGNYVMIEHKNGLVTLYAHMEKVQVKEGQTVKKGTVIGFMGNTGNSFGAHLHFEVRAYNESIDKNNLHMTTAFEWLNAQAYVDIDLPKQTVNPTPVPTPTPSEDLNKNTMPNRFKVLNKDGKQIGAYTNYSLACSFAKTVNAIVIDSANNNKQVYPEEVVKKELTATSYPNYTDGSTYKVMITYNDWSTSKGAFSIFANAFKQWSAYKAVGYHLFNKDGKQLD